jgi:hypothetical protein
MYEQYPPEFYKLVDEFVDSGRCQSRPEAVEAVRRARPDLRSIPTSERPTTTVSHGRAEARLMAVVKQFAAEKQIPFAQAYIEAMNSNMELYAAYLREHTAAAKCRCRP